MPDYRLFDLKPDGDVAQPGEDFFATSDHTAISYAAGRPGPYGCELWSRDRFVAIVAAPEPRPPRDKRRSAMTMAR